MRSISLAGKGVVKVVEGPDPIPGPGEVLIETAVSARRMLLRGLFFTGERFLWPEDRTKRP